MTSKNEILDQEKNAAYLRCNRSLGACLGSVLGVTGLLGEGCRLDCCGWAGGTELLFSLFCAAAAAGDEE